MAFISEMARKAEREDLTGEWWTGEWDTDAGAVAIGATGSAVIPLSTIPLSTPFCVPGWGRFAAPAPAA
jgi:hypothetical protein